MGTVCKTALTILDDYRITAKNFVECVGKKLSDSVDAQTNTLNIISL